MSLPCLLASRSSVSAASQVGRTLSSESKRSKSHVEPARQFVHRLRTGAQAEAALLVLRDPHSSDATSRRGVKWSWSETREVTMPQCSATPSSPNCQEIERASEVFDQRQIESRATTEHLLFVLPEARGVAKQLETWRHQSRYVQTSAGLCPGMESVDIMTPH